MYKVDDLKEEWSFLSLGDYCVIFFLFLFFIHSVLVLHYSLALLQQIRLHYLGEATAAITQHKTKSSTIHFYQCVKHFLVSKQWQGCQCLEFFNTCIYVDQLILQV